MPRFKTKAAKERLLRRVRKQRVKYITILPSLVTILNGVCGFIAIVLASRGITPGIGQLSSFALSGYMILLAMIADMLDGRLARMSQNTSSFGGQLDSLCDIISFGLAPAFLMLKFLEFNLELAGFNSSSFMHRLAWLAALAYISSVAIRLARFNVENEENESAHMSFMGLPSPAAAGVIISLVIFHQEKAPAFNIIVYILPVLALAAAVLMVSRIRYPHILNQYLRGKKPFTHLIRVLLFLGLIIWSVQTALVLIFCGFAASSLVKWIYYKIIRKKFPFAPLAEQTAPAASSDTNIPKQE
jgi:CDP-diacylglycerol--serine O-phosphatidyltransferase